MIKRWIEELKKNSEHFGSHLWKYNISGNVVELFVLPTIDIDMDKYRCAVIKIGQVLQALSVKFDHHAINYHIQSFPNLENPSLVAAIRIVTKKITKSSSEAELPFGNDKGSKTNSKTLSELATFNQLFIDEIPQSNLTAYGIDPNREAGKWFVISSQHDNPFTWLKLGTWNEMVYQTLPESEHENSPFSIIEFCPRESFTPHRQQHHSGKFVQAIAALKT